jgi:hypothetical protein
MKREDKICMTFRFRISKCLVHKDVNKGCLRHTGSTPPPCKGNIVLRKQKYIIHVKFIHSNKHLEIRNLKVMQETALEAVGNPHLLFTWNHGERLATC